MGFSGSAAAAEGAKTAAEVAAAAAEGASVAEGIGAVGAAAEGIGAAGAVAEGFGAAGGLYGADLVGGEVLGGLYGGDLVGGGFGAVADAVGSGGIGYMADAPVNAWANSEYMGSVFGMGDQGMAGLGALSTVGDAASVFGTGANGILAGEGAVGGAGGGLWGTITDAAKIISPISNIGSSLYGMQQQAALRKQALLAANKADSWGASGGRSLADQQLQDFMRNPNPAGDPAYALRIQGAQRATAGMGQDSGAMSVAGANASSGWYNDRLAQLSALAGASGTGAQGQSVGLQGSIAANDLASKSLASLGYGVSRLAEPSQKLPYWMS